MFLRKRRLWLSLICGLLLMTGCWDYRDLDEMNFPVVFGFDTAIDGNSDHVDITALFPALESGIPSPIRIDSIHGAGVGQIRRLRYHRSPNGISTGITQVILYGKDLARKGVQDVQDWNFRNPQTSKGMFIAIADGRAEDILKTKVDEYDSAGSFLVYFMRNIRKHDFVPTITLHQSGVDSFSAGRNPVVPVMKTYGNHRIQNTGAAIFRKEKMIDIIGMDETRALILLEGIHCAGHVPFQVRKDGRVTDGGTARLTNDRTVEVHRDGNRFHFIVSITLDGNLVEHFGQQSLLEDPAYISVMEKAVEQQISRQCRAFVDKMQNQYNLDCIDISRYALAKWRKELMPVIDKDFIQDAVIQVKVKVRIKRVGEIA